MIKRYFQNGINRNFSIAMIWINGGSNLDVNGKKGINQILCSLLTRGCEGTRGKKRPNGTARKTARRCPRNLVS